MEDRNIIPLLRVSHASLDALLAAIAGRRKACATSNRGGGTGGGKMWIGVLFCHESLKTSTSVSDGNK